jgi:hypothetical protein
MESFESLGRRNSGNMPTFPWARIESRRCFSNLDEVAQDRAYPCGVGDARDESHLGAAPTKDVEQQSAEISEELPVVNFV